MLEPSSQIVLDVTKPEDLFYHSVIPLACRRLVHPDVEEFILEEADKLGLQVPFRLLIRTTADSTLPADEVRDRIRRHFEYQAERATQKTKEILQLGWRTLFIAFVFLVIMFFLIKLLVGVLPENAVLITVRELLIILGWVALWRPAELLLYEWRPHRRQTKLFTKLAQGGIMIELKDQ